MDNTILVDIMNKNLVLRQKMFLLHMGFHYLWLDLDSKTQHDMLYMQIELFHHFRSIQVNKGLHLFHHSNIQLDMDYIHDLLRVNKFRLHRLQLWMLHHRSFLLDMVYIRNLLQESMKLIHKVEVQYFDRMSNLLDNLDN